MQRNRPLPSWLALEVNNARLHISGKPDDIE
jgi:hypothetical protein